MDRVAQLAEQADVCLEFERTSGCSYEAKRWATRSLLEATARSLGFPESEISSAIDTALGGR